MSQQTKPLNPSLVTRECTTYSKTAADVSESLVNQVLPCALSALSAQVSKCLKCPGALSAEVSSALNAQATQMPIKCPVAGSA